MCAVLGDTIVPGDRSQDSLSLSLSLSLSRKDREFAFTDGYVDDGVPRKRDELKTHQARRCLMASAEVNAR